MLACTYTVSDILASRGSACEILERLGLSSGFRGAGAVRSGLPALVRRIPLGAKVRECAAAAEHKTVQDIPELPEATDVQAGVVRLSELQEQHYSYIRV